MLYSREKRPKLTTIPSSLAVDTNAVRREKYSGDHSERLNLLPPPMYLDAKGTKKRWLEIQFHNQQQENDETAQLYRRHAQSVVTRSYLTILSRMLANLAPQKKTFLNRELTDSPCDRTPSPWCQELTVSRSQCVACDLELSRGLTVRPRPHAHDIATTRSDCVEVGRVVKRSVEDCAIVLSSSNEHGCLQIKTTGVSHMSERVET